MLKEGQTDSLRSKAVKGIGIVSVSLLAAACSGADKNFSHGNTDGFVLEPTATSTLGLKPSEVPPAITASPMLEPTAAPILPTPEPTVVSRIEPTVASVPPTPEPAIIPTSIPISTQAPRVEPTAVPPTPETDFNAGAELTSFARKVLKAEYASNLPNLNIAKSEVKKNDSGKEYVIYSDKRVMINGIKFEMEADVYTDGKIGYEDFNVTLINNPDNTLSAIQNTFNKYFNVPGALVVPKDYGSYQACELVVDNPDGTWTSWAVTTRPGNNAGTYSYLLAVYKVYPGSDPFSKHSVLP